MHAPPHHARCLRARLDSVEGFRPDGAVKGRGDKEGTGGLGMRHGAVPLLHSIWRQRRQDLSLQSLQTGPLKGGKLGEHFDIRGAEGAFYLFLPAPWGTGSEFVKAAIEQSLLIIPGNVFSPRDTHFRISYAAPDHVLKRGAEILRKLAKSSR